MSVETAEVERLKWRKDRSRRRWKDYICQRYSTCKVKPFYRAKQALLPKCKIANLLRQSVLQLPNLRKIVLFCESLRRLGGCWYVTAHSYFLLHWLFGAFCRLLPTRESESEISAHCHDTARHCESELHKQLL